MPEPTTTPDRIQPISDLIPAFIPVERVAMDVDPRVEMKLVVTFARIGRHRDVPPLELESPLTREALEDRIWEYARKHLGSQFFDVSANPNTGRGSIGQGRFGTFTVQEVPA